MGTTTASNVSATAVMAAEMATVAADVASTTTATAEEDVAWVQKLGVASVV